MVKRNLPDATKEEAKRPKTVQEQAKMKVAFEKIMAIQQEIQQMDEECSKEQLAIQQKFDKKCQPLTKQRQDHIAQIPGFWGYVLLLHPAMEGLCERDREILQHLSKVDLEDNLDEEGSYKITFTFDEKASEYFEPLTISKSVTVDAETEEEKADVTPIVFKQEHREIKRAEEDADADAEFEPWTLFDWFSSDAETVLNVPPTADIGELFRSSLWHDLVPDMEEIINSEDNDEDDAVQEQ